MRIDQEIRTKNSDKKGAKKFNLLLRYKQKLGWNKVSILKTKKVIQLDLENKMQNC